MTRRYNVAARVEVNCPSGILHQHEKNRVVLLVDSEFQKEFEETVGDVYLRESNARYMNVPVISTIALVQAFPKTSMSLTNIMLGRKRIRRVDPYPREVRKSFVYDNRMSNFKLTAPLKAAIIKGNPYTVRPSVLREMTTFGDLLEHYGPETMKQIVKRMAAHC